MAIYERTSDRTPFSGTRRGNIYVNIVDPNDTTQDANGSDYNIELTNLFQKANAVYIDGTNGSDTTGAFGHYEFKFATIQAAIAAIPTATTDCTIFIFNGTYSEAINFNSFVNASACEITFILLGATIQNTEGAAIFSKSTGNAIDVKMRGFGNIVQTDNFQVFNFSVANCDFEIDGLTISATGTSGIFATDTSSNVVLKNSSISSVSRHTTTAASVYAVNCTLSSSASYVYSSASIELNYCNISTPASHCIEANTLFKAHSTRFSSNSTAIVITNDTDIYLDFCKFATTDEPIDLTGGFSVNAALNFNVGKTANIATGAISISTNYAQNTAII